jgi:hypothetical protein
MAGSPSQQSITHADSCRALMALKTASVSTIGPRAALMKTGLRFNELKKCLSAR